MSPAEHPTTDAALLIQPVYERIRNAFDEVM
jgi:hypothetical protein